MRDIQRDQEEEKREPKSIDLGGEREPESIEEVEER